MVNESSCRKRFSQNEKLRNTAIICANVVLCFFICVHLPLNVSVEMKLFNAKQKRRMNKPNTKYSIRTEPENEKQKSEYFRSTCA